VTGAGDVGVADELLEEEVAVEDIDAHRRQGRVVAAGDGRRLGGLLDKAAHAPFLVHAHDAEAAARSRSTSMQPTVMSAPDSTCCAIMVP
jgi:hypothetical protein